MQGFYIPKKNTSNIFCKRVCFEHAVTDELPYHTIQYLMRRFVPYMWERPLLQIRSGYILCIQREDDEGAGWEATAPE